MKPDSPLTADVDRQLTLLRLAARVDPNLRQAVADVEDAIAALRTQLEQAQKGLDEFLCDWHSSRWPFKVPWDKPCGPVHGVWGPYLTKRCGIARRALSGEGS